MFLDPFDPIGFSTIHSRESTHTSGDDKVVLWSANNFSSLYSAEKYPPDRFVQSKSRFGIRNLPKIGLKYTSASCGGAVNTTVDDEG